MRNYLIELWAVEQVFAKAVVLDLEFIIGEYPMDIIHDLIQTTDYA